MKKLVSILFAAIAAFSLPMIVSAQDKPQTPEDCKKVFAGDDAKVKACIDGLKK
jgi:hypothetical protein